MTERKSEQLTFGEQFMRDYSPKVSIPVIKDKKSKYDEDVYNKLLRAGKHHEAKLVASGQASEALRSLLDNSDK